VREERRLEEFRPQTVLRKLRMIVKSSVRRVAGFRPALARADGWRPSFVFSFMAFSNFFSPSTACRLWAVSRPLRIFWFSCSCGAASLTPSEEPR
jgi:hypothetical protein